MQEAVPYRHFRGDQDPRIQDLISALQREAARGGMAIDAAAYEEDKLDPTMPVLLGSGDLDARVGFFGRDPGRTELTLREPFIGQGGKLVRDALHRHHFGSDAPDQLARVEVGQRHFWANTVPYKPAGNKAWSMAVKRRFAPIIRRLLAERWTGTELITFGNVAFDWFRLAWPEHTEAIRNHWAREDRYEATLPLQLGTRIVKLRPLPHPSPLNATWYGRLPAMLDARLRECTAAANLPPDAPTVAH